MSVISLAGFDTGLVDCGNNSSGTLSVQNSVARNGGYALRTNPTTTGTGRVGCSFLVFGTYNTAYFRFYFRYATKPGSGAEELFGCTTNSSPATPNKFSLRLTSAGQIAAYNSALTLLGTGSTVLAQDTWYRIEAMVGTGSSAAYEVRIDGVTELSGTSNLNTTRHNTQFLGKLVNRSSQSIDFYYDDWLADSTDWPGPGATKLLLPAANGTHQDFSITAGSGAAWEQVDDLPSDNATTYLTGTGASSRVSFLTQSCATAGISGTILGTVVYPISRNSAGGTPLGRAFIRVGSTDYDQSSDSTPGAFPATLYIPTGLKLFNATNPATGIAWTIDDIDAMEIGLCDNSISTTLDLTAIYLAVGYVPGQDTPELYKNNQLQQLLAH